MNMKVDVRSKRLALAGFLLVALALLQLASAPRAEAQIQDDRIYSYFLFEELEYVPGLAGDPVTFDFTSWIGGDYNRLWVRAEGELTTTEDGGAGEVQALYGRLIAPFFDALVGVRVDTRWGGGSSDVRGLLAAGVTGLAPYQFEVSPTLFVSQDADVSARLEASYGLLLTQYTQRLILTPEIELNAALQDAPAWGVGSGLNDLELGLRLRYEIWREFAPYVGYSWTWLFGETADFARAAGEDTSSGAFVFGVRVWR